jgi:hypothetical protein
MRKSIGMNQQVLMNDVLSLLKKAARKRTIGDPNVEKCNLLNFELLSN